MEKLNQQQKTYNYPQLAASILRQLFVRPIAKLSNHFHFSHIVYSILLADHELLAKIKKQIY